ncbi:MAG: hypothetical protein DWQ06_14175 [Calditrichaeota bacterium]|nr:MAG: hypothetical protein DWQ06_14175 [Calditrichota bacterium]
MPNFKILLIVFLLSVSAVFGQSSQDEQLMKELGMNQEELKKLELFISQIQQVNGMIKEENWSVKISNAFALTESGNELSNSLVRGSIELYHDNSNLRKMKWNRGGKNASKITEFYYDANGKLLGIGEEDGKTIKFIVLENNLIFLAVEMERKENSTFKSIPKVDLKKEVDKFIKLATTLPDLLDILLEQD